jgi:MYXO-CTERM domain-containing protein
MGDRVVLIAEGTAAIQSYRRSETPSQGLHDIRMQPDLDTDVPNASTGTMGMVALALMGLGALAMMRTRKPSNA